MDRVHLALVVVGLLMLCEAVWGLAAPRSIKRLVDVSLPSLGASAPILGGSLLALGTFLWFLILLDLPIVYWLLLFIGALLGGAGLICFREGGLELLLRSLVVERSVAMLRLMYGLELVAALWFVWLSLADRT